MPVYQKFVERAIEMDPRYVLMITRRGGSPAGSVWMNSGPG